jgi:hypothetical protein
MKTIQVGGHRKNSKIEYAMIDDEDFELVSQYNWTLDKKSNTTYALTQQLGNKIYLHRLLTGLNFGDKRVVNHIDGNGLNNQRSNIEVCSQMYNSQSINKPNSKKGTIYCDNKHKRRTKPYRASIIINKVRHSKYFTTEEEAKQFISDKLKEYEA